MPTWHPQSDDVTHGWFQHGGSSTGSAPKLQFENGFSPHTSQQASGGGVPHKFRGSRGLASLEADRGAKLKTPKFSSAQERKLKGGGQNWGDIPPYKWARGFFITSHESGYRHKPRFCLLKFSTVRKWAGMVSGVSKETVLDIPLGVVHPLCKPKLFRVPKVAEVMSWTWSYQLQQQPLVASPAPVLTPSYTLHRYISAVCLCSLTLTKPSPLNPASPTEEQRKRGRKPATSFMPPSWLWFLACLTPIFWQMPGS